jgi:predicted nucleic acid-binding protein
MVLVDTSVWVAHLRDGNVRLEVLLNEGNVVCHPFIIRELACGNIVNRKEIIVLLQSLPIAIPAEHDEVLQFIENNSLMGRVWGMLMCISWCQLN